MLAFSFLLPPSKSYTASYVMLYCVHNDNDNNDDTDNDNTNTDDDDNNNSNNDDNAL